MTKRQVRLQRILELLEERGRIETAVLASELDVTDLTIRRDIDQLDREGLARRVYGGIEMPGGRSFEPPFAFRVQRNVEVKRAMARAAVERIPRASNVAIDFGTKAYFVAEEMRRTRLQVLAAPTSVQVMEMLGQAPGVRVLSSGGELKPVELSFHGPATEEFFRSHRWDIAIVSVAGIQPDADVLSDYDEADARLKRTMIEAADRVIVLVERRHVGVVSFAPVASLSRVATVITDATDDPALAQLEQRGIEVARVGA